MTIIKNRFVSWLLSLTLVLRCFVIALLIHVALLLSLGAIKLGVAIARPEWKPERVVMDGESGTTQEIDPRRPSNNEFEPVSSLPKGNGIGGLHAASTLPTEGITSLGTVIDVISESFGTAPVRFTSSSSQLSFSTGKQGGGGTTPFSGGPAGTPGNPFGNRPGTRPPTGKPTAEPPDDTERAVLAGLRWLKANQNPDGTWDCRQSKSAGTALGVLAFLGRGETPESKEFGVTVQRGLQYLLSCVDDNGLVKDHNMYAQGVVTLALAEGYGMTGAAPIREALNRAVHAILLSQKAAKKRPEHVGGWRYTASASDSDTSVSGWLVMALKSAHLAGLEIPKDSFEQATKYLWSVYDPSGGFGYSENRRSPNMTGVGVLCQQFLGHGRDPRLDKALDYLASHKMSWEDTAGSWVLYGWYYTTQAMYQAGGAHWRSWEKQLRKTVVNAQATDGHWAVPPQSKSEDNGPAYSTALSCLILEVYYRYLPIYREMEKRPVSPMTASAR